jgi:ribonuclease HII
VGPVPVRAGNGTFEPVPTTRTARRGAGRSPGRPPNLALEQELWAEGHEVVVGLDEVGRGAWAGPLSIGAVVLPRDRRVNGVRDSKMLTERRREQLYRRLADWCVAWSVGHVSHDECDRIGMSAAQRLAAQRALEGLDVPADVVLVDGNWDFVGGGRTRTVVRGDATCLSIATASVLAKVTRDRWMREESTHYPGYDFDRNKGYPCPRHKLALKGYGPTPIHRRTWAFMESIPWPGQRLPAPGEQDRLF